MPSGASSNTTPANSVFPSPPIPSALPPPPMPSIMKPTSPKSRNGSATPISPLPASMTIAKPAPKTVPPSRFIIRTWALVILQTKNNANYPHKPGYRSSFQQGGWIQSQGREAFPLPDTWLVITRPRQPMASLPPLAPGSAQSDLPLVAVR